MAFDLAIHRQEGPEAMSSPTISGNATRMLDAGKGTENLEYRAPRGAQKVTVPFPDAWADARDSYEFAELTRGHSPKSVSTRRSSVLRLAKQYPERSPEAITRRDLERHITSMRKTLQPMTVFGAYNDLRSFFGWLAIDTGRADSIMKDIRVKQPDMADVPVLTPSS
jgi:hypothetical protein